MIRKAMSVVVVTLLAAPGALGGEGTNQTAPASGPPAPTASFLKDRGTGVPTSMFGTYIRRGELIVYPFFEYYKDDDYEYKPEELGYPGDTDYRGRYRASEGLLFLAYGLTDDLALEAEAAVIDASLEKAPSDTSALPSRIEESGLGDLEAQLRWRFAREKAGRPEFFSYFETVFPHRQDKVLIGTPGWELKLGAGLVKGFRWGTLTARLAVEYDEASSSELDLGEYAIEYLKRLSPKWRVYVGIEGTQDEVELVTEVQWHLARNVFLKVNSGFGITSKATDWAPEVGLLFTLPTRRTPR
jgi:hypothetical protein